MLRSLICHVYYVCPIYITQHQRHISYIFMLLLEVNIFLHICNIYLKQTERLEWRLCLLWQYVNDSDIIRPDLNHFIHSTYSEIVVFKIIAKWIQLSTSAPVDVSNSRPWSNHIDNLRAIGNKVLKVGEPINHSQ